MAMESTPNRVQGPRPESLGVPSRAILGFLDRLEREGQDHHAFTLRRHGTIVAEGAWAPYRLEDRHRMFSVSKSVTSLAIGFLAQEGRLSLDDTATGLLPDGAAICRDPRLATVTVRHLLTMTTGQKDDPIFTLGSKGTWVEGFFGEPCVEAPGSTFRYNSTATYVLSAIVSRLAGMKLTDYLQPRLFGPLGLGPVPSELSPEGICAGGWGLYLRVGELARIGQFLLQRGVWEGRRLLSADYLDEAVSLKIETAEGFGHGYGYQFWRCPDDGYRMDGAFGQVCLVMPDRDAVLAATNGLHDGARAFRGAWELREAMVADPLPEDPEARGELEARLSGLRHRVEGGDPSSPMEAKVSGRTYRLSGNKYGLRSIRIQFPKTGCAIWLETDRGTFEAAAAGDGEYGPTGPGWDELLLPWLAFGARQPDPRPGARVFAASRWLASDRFRFSLRFSDSPTRDDWTLAFSGDGRRCTVTQTPSAIMEFTERDPLEGISID